MKRYLKHDRYQLNDLEREHLWHGIRRELKPGAAGRPPGSGAHLRPALVAAATVAAAGGAGRVVDRLEPVGQDPGDPSRAAGRRFRPR